MQTQPLEGHSVSVKVSTKATIFACKFTMRHQSHSYRMNANRSSFNS